MTGALCKPLDGFKPSAVVFRGLFPIDAADFSGLREALEKLSLNDSSFSFEAETSVLLGLASAVVFWGCYIWRSSVNG